jgi:predicted GNAT superfamily acetyltransferase
VSILLRKIETMEELNEMARLEAEIWGTSPIPTHQTVTVAKNGGIIIGALADEKMGCRSFLFFVGSDSPSVSGAERKKSFTGA